jgi:hypothetical protein
MKNIFVFMSLFGLLIMGSCNKDFLNKQPLDEFSELDVFKDPALIEVYVNDIYGSLENPTGGFDGVLKGEFVDEAHDMWYNYFEFNNCLLTNDGLQGWKFENWDGFYSNIRKCNLFFEKVDNGVFENTLIDGKPLKDRLIGEVHFLRAYFYHQMVSLYGGVPIIKNTFTLTDEFKTARNTYSDCIDFIAEECDLAASMLPEVNSGANTGRATKGAALALKSEVLLYAASDLHNNNPKFSGFSNRELLGYTSGNSQDRWLAAKNAAKAVIDLGIYGLYKADPAPTENIAQNYSDIFITKSTEEDIYIKYFISKEGGALYGAYGSAYGYNLALVAGPNGYHLWGQDAPSGNLVDDFEMIDGSKFSWSNPAQAAEPYKNRDPRFYGTVLYEGVKWRQRTPDVIPIDPVGVIQVGTWETWDNSANKMVEVFGLDTRNSPIEPWNGGYTGYYLRKFIDPTIDPQYAGQDVPWRSFRYAEILLNYAEACIELHEDGTARTYLNMIRKRSGMPDITESGDALRRRYRHERRIELAMEGNRFYDVRRWVLGHETYVDLTGVNVRYKLNPDNTTSATPTITPMVVQTRAWLDKAYFFPIMRTEINKNDLLIQNPGY